MKVSQLTTILFSSTSALILSGCFSQAHTQTPTTSSTESLTQPEDTTLRIDAVLPTRSSSAGGLPVRIKGNGFDPRSLVKIGGNTCTSFFYESNQYIRCILPESPVGKQDVSITNPDGSYTRLPKAISFYPGASSFNPQTGPVTGGTQLTVVGSGLSADSKITLGGADCIPVTKDSSGNLLCPTPPAVAGDAEVIVRDDVNGVTVTLGNFTYVPQITSILPSHAFNLGGKKLTIKGTGFKDGAKIRLGSSNCDGVQFIDDTTLTCTTVATDQEARVDVQVQNSTGEQAIASQAFSFESADLAPIVDVMNQSIFKSFSPLLIDELKNFMKTDLRSSLDTVAKSTGAKLESVDLHFSDLKNPGIPAAKYIKETSTVQLRMPSEGSYMIQASFKRTDWCIGTCVTHAKVEIPITFIVKQVGLDRNAVVTYTTTIPDSPKVTLSGSLKWVFDMNGFSKKIREEVKKSVVNAIAKYPDLFENSFHMSPVTVDKDVEFQNTAYEWVYGKGDSTFKTADIVVIGDLIKSSDDQKYFDEVAAHIGANLMTTDSVFAAHKDNFRVLKVNVDSSNGGLFLSHSQADNIKVLDKFSWGVSDYGSLARILRQLPNSHPAAIVIVVPPSARSAQSGSHTTGNLIVLDRDGDTDPASATLELAHQLGHAWGKLADESIDHSLEHSLYLGDEPLAANQTIGKMKWNDLLDSGFGYLEGAQYPNGIFRPSDECRMGEGHSSVFCTVCHRAMEKAIQQLIASDHVFRADTLRVDDHVGVAFIRNSLFMIGYGPKDEIGKNCTPSTSKCSVEYQLPNFNVQNGSAPNISKNYRATVRINGRNGVYAELALCAPPDRTRLLYTRTVKSNVDVKITPQGQYGYVAMVKVDPQPGAGDVNVELYDAGYAEDFDSSVGCGTDFTSSIGFH